VSLALTWPCRLCLLRVLLVVTTTATSFPLSKHTGGGDTAPDFSGQRVYLQFMWEMGLPHSPVEFSSHHHFYKLSRSWLLGVCRHSCLLQPACCEGFPLPPLQCSGHPAFFAMCLFCCYCLLFSFFSFFPCVGGFSVQGAMLIWPRVVCGSAECRLAHLVVHVFLSCLGAAIWQQCGSPPPYYVFTITCGTHRARVPSLLKLKKLGFRDVSFP
jgi:hypothetical protein